MSDGFVSRAQMGFLKIAFWCYALFASFFAPLVVYILARRQIRRDAATLDKLAQAHERQANKYRIAQFFGEEGLEEKILEHETLAEEARRMARALRA